MRRGAKHDVQSLAHHRIVRALPAADRGRWLVGFARLYREAVAAARATPDLFGQYPWRVVPISWRIKLAMFTHVLTVHRYKERDDHLLAAAGLGRPLPIPVEGPVADGEDVELSGGVVPGWVLEDLKSFSENEPSLWPDGDFISGFQTYRPALRLSPGWLYFEIYSRTVRTDFGVIVVAPWLKRGGATKGTLQFLKYYSDRYRTLLITTLDVDSPCRAKVPTGVQVVEFGKLATDIAEDDKIAVLSRLFLELKPNIIHVINSDLGWRCLAEHGTALKANCSRLIASAFSEEMTPSGRRIGYPITYIPEVNRYIDLVITDNCVYLKTLMRRYSLSTRQARCVHFWTPVASQENPDPSVDGVPEAARILFAGRLSYEKRLDILYGIAFSCRECEFHVFGEAQENRFVARWCGKLANLPNVWLHGHYDEFGSIIAGSSYRGFLYTTAFDGLPNVLLEAASHNLPIIAPPAIGGLADLISAETAFPVDDAGEAESYIRALRRCLADPAEAARRAQNALAVVRAQHSREAFEAAMDEAIVSLT